MLRSFFSSLRARLLLLVFLAVIPALALILYTVAAQRQIAAEEARADAAWLARLVAADQERLIAETRQLLLTLAHLSEVRSGNPADCSSLFAKLLRQYPQYADLGAVSPQGEITCSALDLVSPPNLAEDPSVRRAIQELAFTVGNYQIDRRSGVATIRFAYPVLDESYQIQSVVFASLDLTWLNDVLGTYQLPEGAALSIFDRNRAILVHYPDPARWVGQALPAQSGLLPLLEAGEGTQVVRGPDGIERLYALIPLRDITETGFYVAVGVSEQVAFARANQVTGRYLAALGIVFLLAIALAWIGGDLFVLGGVRSLLHATQQLAAGDLSVRTGLPYGEGEIGQLARSFDQMTEAMQQRADERQRAESEMLEQNKALTALNTITAAVSSSLELPEILESLKGLLVEQLNLPGGIVLFYDESCDALYVEAAWGLPAATLAEFKRFPAERYHYGQVIRQIRPVVQPDFRQVEAFAGLGLERSRPNWRSYICIPLLAKGRVQGVLDLFSQASDGFSPDYLTLLTALGQQVGMAVQNARLYEQVRSSRRQLQMLSQQLLEVQEAERRHIARELHDEIGQALTAVKVNLQSINRLINDGELFSPLEDSIGIVERTLQQVRDLSLDLRPSLLDDLGVVSALRWYIDRQAQRAGFKTRFVADLPRDRLPADLETTCFRVVQEALTNIVRHANARQVLVELHQVEGMLELVIRDDGVGFDVDAVREHAAGDLSLGILGMQERVQLMGGTMTIRSDPNRGTEIRATFPPRLEQALNAPMPGRGSDS